MLYIFDLGNVVVDLDFTRALGVWSNLSGTPLAQLQQHFQLGKPVAAHERGAITDQQFAAELCNELEINLSYQQFVSGWNAIFTGLNRTVLTHIQQLRAEGQRVVILSNTNKIHTDFLIQHYPEIFSSVDQCYFSYQLGLRKPDLAIYHHILAAEGVTGEQAIFFDDLIENIEAAAQIGINAHLYVDEESLTRASNPASR